MPPVPASRGQFRFTWIKAPNAEMAPNCLQRAKAFQPTLFEQLEEVAFDIQDYMKSNAPWTDRTGAARAGLSASANLTGSGVSVVARHGVFYGGYLETGTSKMSAYPIVGPSLQAHYAAVRAIMNEIAGSG